MALSLLVRTHLEPSHESGNHFVILNTKTMDETLPGSGNEPRADTKCLPQKFHRTSRSNESGEPVDDTTHSQSYSQMLDPLSSRYMALFSGIVPD